jgi:Rod binding domain-containing protein
VIKTIDLNPGITGAREPAKPPSEEAVKAAREFESLLLRHVLKSLEKTTSIGPASQSSSTYRSMITDALADGIGQSGGLGMADLLARDLDIKLGNQSGIQNRMQNALDLTVGRNLTQASEKPAVHTKQGELTPVSPPNGESR